MKHPYILEHKKTLLDLDDVVSVSYPKLETVQNILKGEEQVITFNVITIHGDKLINTDFEYKFQNSSDEYYVPNNNAHGMELAMNDAKEDYELLCEEICGFQEDDGFTYTRS